MEMSHLSKFYLTCSRRSAIERNPCTAGVLFSPNESAFASLCVGAINFPTPLQWGLGLRRFTAASSSSERHGERTPQFTTVSLLVSKEAKQDTNRCFGHGLNHWRQTYSGCVLVANKEPDGPHYLLSSTAQLNTLTPSRMSTYPGHGVPNSESATWRLERCLHLG